MRFPLSILHSGTIALAFFSSSIQAQGARKSEGSSKPRTHAGFSQLDQIHGAALTHKVSAPKDSALSNPTGQSISADQASPAFSSATAAIQPKMAVQSRAMMQTPMRIYRDCAIEWPNEWKLCDFCAVTARRCAE